MSGAKRRPIRSQRNPRAWIWLTLGILIGLGIAKITSTDDHQADPLQTGSTAHDEQGGTSGKPPAQRTFDFYTILPELEVVIPEEETKNPAHRERTILTGEYLLQVGSFQQLDDADNLKTRLAQLNVTANVQSVSVNNETWHRVRIGPVSNRQYLEQIRGHLRTNGIDAMLIQVKQ